MTKAEKQYDEALRRVYALQRQIALARIKANNAQIILANERKLGAVAQH